MGSSDHLIIALDVDRASVARELVDRLGPRARFYKVGMQLFTAEGPEIVRELVNAGNRVFLDLKLHEIPNSVAGAVHAAGGLGVSMVSVHASGGSAVLGAAVEAAKHYEELSVIALTVVTSLGDRELREIGVEAGVQAQVARLARLADRAGCRGVVASPQEAAGLRASLRPDMHIVTPGVRLAEGAHHDQARVATPGDALRAGASHVVVGRTILQAPDPVAVVDRIEAELALALD